MQKSNSVEKLNGWILKNDVDSVGGRETTHHSPVKSVPSNRDINDALNPEMATTDDLSRVVADNISTSDSSTLQPKSQFPVRNNNLEASWSTGPKKTPEIMDDNKRNTERHSVRDEDGDNSELKSKVEPINGIVDDEENNFDIKLDSQTLDVILSHLLMDAGIQD